MPTLLYGARCPEGDIAVRDALGRAILGLAERQRLVLRLGYVDELTQSEIGERVGVSQMHVSRILRTVLNALRDLLDERDDEIERTG